MASKQRICVDFDGTIYDGVGIIDGCIEKLTALSEKYVISIFSARATEPERCQMEDILKRFGVPYDEILGIKPDAVVYIDDKGRQFTSWENICL